MSESCDCCQGVNAVTPEATANRPGLSALSFRVGTHASFLETMKARLSSPDFPALAGLKTRDGSDPAVALLDAWAVVADILTFYQQRIANEGYLRTATERRSVLELGRLVGYALRPGVAASVSLAFTLDAGSATTITAGTRVQSIPGPGQLPQTFETSYDLPARGLWNNLEPRTRRPQLIDPDQIRPGRRIYLKGIATNLHPNDPLLFDGDFDPRSLPLPSVLDPAHLQRVQSVTSDAAANVTTVVLQPWKPALNSMATRAAAAGLSPAGDGVAQQIDQILAEFAETRAFGEAIGFPPDVPLDTQIGRRTYADLVALSTRGAQDRGATGGSTATLSSTQASVRDQDRQAGSGKYPRLGPWLDDLLNDLEQVAPVSSAARPGRAPAPPSVSGTLLGLAMPPSVPVARNAQSLVRPLKETFAPGSEAGARLLTALNPALGDHLFDALATVANARLATSKAALTLKVKAAPFGSVAPLRPVLDDRGFVVKTEEWPLRTVVVGVTFSRSSRRGQVFTRLTRDAVPDVVVRATIDTGDGPRSTDLTLSSTQATDFPPPQFGPDDGMNVTTVTSPDTAKDHTIEFVFANSAVGRFKTIVLKLKDPLSVQIEDDPDRVVTPESTDRYERGPGDKVTIVSTTKGDVLLSIVEESADLTRGLTSDFFRVVTLDAPYDQIAVGSRVVIDRPDPPAPTSGAAGSAVQGLDVYVVMRTRTVAKAAYGVTGKVTELTLDRPWLTPQDTSLALFRQTTVYGQEGPLALADAPFDADVEGDVIELDGVYDGLEPGRWIIVAGERTDIPGTTGVMDAERVMLAGSDLVASSYLPGFDAAGRVVPNAAQVDLPGDTLHTVLRLANRLAFSFKRDTVTVFGNVVDATNGETRSEVLGNGDGSRPLQQFTLKQTPLTYVAADTPSGVASTLQVFVDKIRWHETTRPDLLGPTDRAFVTSTDDDNKVTITFGDGVRGARLPTGIGNVSATYRFGIGTAANVGAGQISQLSTRPLHVTSVVNPIAAAGGGDREELAQARGNIPLGLSALDRLVSTDDYQDFARTFAGIAKASALRLTDGRRQVVHLTIAGDSDAAIDPLSDLYHNLTRALADFGDPAQAVRIDPRTLRLLVLDAGIHIHSDFQWDSVVDQVRSALMDAFGFDHRGLGQDAYLGEVIRVLQSVPGVDYVDVMAFGAIPPLDFDPTVPLTPDELSAYVTSLVKAQQTAGAPDSRVAVSLATFAGGVIRPAQIAVLSPAAPQTLNLRQILP